MFSIFTIERGSFICSKNGLHLRKLFILICPWQGLNSDLWDRKLACWQLSHAYLNFFCCMYYSFICKPGHSLILGKIIPLFWQCQFILLLLHSLLHCIEKICLSVSHFSLFTKTGLGLTKFECQHWICMLATMHNKTCFFLSADSQEKKVKENCFSVKKIAFLRWTNTIKKS